VTDVFDQLARQRGTRRQQPESADQKQPEHHRCGECEASRGRRILAESRERQFQRSAHATVEDERIGAELPAGGAGFQVRAHLRGELMRLTADGHARMTAIDTHSASSAGVRP
jgi:hypothetical protein